MAQSDPVSIIGAVIDCMPPRVTQNDWMITFELHDGSQSHRVRFFSAQDRLPLIETPGDVVILRNAKTSTFRGEKLLGRGPKTEWIVFPANEIPSEMPPSKSVKDRRLNGVPVPTATEVQRAIDLRNSRDLPQFSAPLSAETLAKMMKPQGSKFALIKDLQIDGFYDLVGQVIKIYWNSRGWIDLYLSDYTSHQFLYDQPPPWEKRGDEEFDYVSQSKRDWPGPFGKRAILVTLFDLHAQWAREHVDTNNYVLLQNVHTAYKGNHNDMFLQGKLRTDDRHRDRIKVSVLGNDDERVRAVLRRKRDYEKQYKTEMKKSQPNRSEEEEEPKRQDQPRKAAQPGKVDRGEKRKSDGAGNDDVPPKRSKQVKNAERKKRTKARKKEEAERMQAEHNNGSAAQQPTPETSDGNEARAVNIIAPRKALQELNPNVRCAHPNHPTRSVAEILNNVITHKRKFPDGVERVLPFSNYTSRSIFRVLDYKPPRLEDFCFKRRVSEYDVLKEGGSGDDGSSASSQSGSDASSDEEGNGLSAAPGSTSFKWVWAFDLMLEDANPDVPSRPGGKRERIPVKVAEDDAVHLLQMDPVDLREHPEMLEQLRQKLFLLWGDLEERKLKKLKDTEDLNMTEEPSTGRPFSAWVKEYGRRVKGNTVDYLRLMRLTDTTIMFSSG